MPGRAVPLSAWRCPEGRSPSLTAAQREREARALRGRLRDGRGGLASGLASGRRRRRRGRSARRPNCSDFSLRCDGWRRRARQWGLRRVGSGAMPCGCHGFGSSFGGGLLCDGAPGGGDPGPAHPDIRSTKTSPTTPLRSVIDSSVRISTELSRIRRSRSTRRTDHSNSACTARDARVILFLAIAAMWRIRKRRRWLAQEGKGGVSTLPSLQGLGIRMRLIMSEPESANMRTSG